MTDSLQFVLDSLKFAYEVKGKELDREVEMWKYIGTLLFGLLTFWLGGYSTRKQQKEQQDRQDKSETKREMLGHKFKVYVAASEALSRVYSVKLDHGGKDGTLRQYPAAYTDLKTAKDWMTEIVALYDKHRFLFDDGSYKAFESLNHYVLNHHLKVAKTDEELKDLGAKDISEVQGLVNGAYKVMREYLNQKYGLDLEEARVS